MHFSGQATSNYLLCVFFLGKKGDKQYIDNAFVKVNVKSCFDQMHK